jgi:hypothetical protein
MTFFFRMFYLQYVINRVCRSEINYARDNELFDLESRDGLFLNCDATLANEKYMDSSRMSVGR